MFNAKRVPWLHADVREAIALAYADAKEVGVSFSNSVDWSRGLTNGRLGIFSRLRLDSVRL